uniref:Uncharacterized protein n=1 Tax=Timema tahoe TaxID=61484 RepID=A0A7R9INS8_9NEOP|nr:unnamed protein product [Timema tahoe]
MSTLTLFTAHSVYVYPRSFYGTFCMWMCPLSLGPLATLSRVTNQRSLTGFSLRHQWDSPLRPQPVPPLISTSGGPEVRMSGSTTAACDLSPRGGLGEGVGGGGRLPEVGPGGSSRRAPRWYSYMMSEIPELDWIHIPCVPGHKKSSFNIESLGLVSLPSISDRPETKQNADPCNRVTCKQVLNFMVILGFMFNYMLRVNLTIAIVAMVHPGNKTDSSGHLLKHTSECSGLGGSTDNNNTIARVLDNDTLERTSEDKTPKGLRGKPT